MTVLPTGRPVPAETVQRALGGARRVVFLDDDPTGTQTIRDLPVLTRWSVADVEWALSHATAGFFVLTNTRSLAPELAAERDHDVVTNCLIAAERMDVPLTFASRSDSTLRGHFPLETDVISEVLAGHGQHVDCVLLAPAYVDAGRVTIDGVHMLDTDNGLIPIAASEFARDASFGYQSSRLADWVAEKSSGRIEADDVVEISLDAIRTSPIADLADRFAAARDGRIVVVDAVTDDDLRVVALAVIAAEASGTNIVYRIGPSFVRARTGQPRHGPVEVTAGDEPPHSDGSNHGLVVVGSHVALSTRQLARLAQRHELTNIEIDVTAVLNDSGAERHLQEAASAAAAALVDTLVVLSTSRILLSGADHTASLTIARRVSRALTDVTQRTFAARRPAFVVAKGGITSSDIATDALGIERAWVRGSVLDGIVSLWDPVSGPAAHLPYVVFPGNVGDDDALADVVDRLVAT